MHVYVWCGVCECVCVCVCVCECVYSKQYVVKSSLVRIVTDLFLSSGELCGGQRALWQGHS